jgi:hypothetical protein
MIALRKNLSNVLGWNTKRKIIVIESDDWGSIRTRSKKDYFAMLSAKLGVDKSNFTINDCLESNTDLEGLFGLLLQFKDSTGRPPVITPMAIMANPDFNKIEQSGFETYYYENFVETCKKYPNHDRVLELWRKGIEERLFVPGLHGREHLNASKWLKLLKEKHGGILTAFKHESFGVAFYKGEKIPEYLAAFNPEASKDIQEYDTIITEGFEMFQQNCGFKATHFIASNSSEPKSMENVMRDLGIKFLTRYKIQNYPLGDGKFQKEINWLGKINHNNQLYLTRNSGFEPSDPSKSNWVSSCIHEIENAFFWHKPAIISSHRVNYIGSINKLNAHYGLNQLGVLLETIIKRWPNVEFMTSMELGETILSEKNA